jgi:hypothetical protein
LRIEVGGDQGVVRAEIAGADEAEADVRGGGAADELDRGAGVGAVRAGRVAGWERAENDAERIGLIAADVD